MKRCLSLVLFLLTANSFALSVNQFDLSPYGFVKASMTGSDHAASSYNNINMSAPTNASPETRNIDRKSRSSFQGQQSRVGVNLKKGTEVDAKLEFDFIDFSKSSPTTQMVPRVRIASVTYHIDDNNKLILGQDWDMFSPVTTYTFDYVGLYFLAGNSGFMRQQAQYLHNSGNFEFGAALGMAGNNPGVADSDLEFGAIPTLAMRQSYSLGSNSRVGLSEIYTKLNYESTTGRKSDTYGFNAFFEKVFESFALKSEAYYGQNLANIGALTIGKGSDTADVCELGGFLSGQIKLNDKNQIMTGAGFTRVTNNYSHVKPFSLSSAGTIANTGIIQNNLARIAEEFKANGDLSWITEFTHYNTSTKISANSIKTANANVLETGVVLKF